MSGISPLPPTLDGLPLTDLAFISLMVVGDVQLKWNYELKIVLKMWNAIILIQSLSSHRNLNLAENFLLSTESPADLRWKIYLLKGNSSLTTHQEMHFGIKFKLKAIYLAAFSRKDEK